MACLLDFSHELLHAIFANVDPVDLASLSSSCSALNSYIKNNRLLCKELYLSYWDHPVATQEQEICWETELRKLVTLQKVLACEDLEKKRNDFELVADAIISLLKAPKSRLNVPFLSACFTSQSNIDAFLAASSLFEHAGTSSQIPAATAKLRQLSAHMHCLYGVPIDSRKLCSYQRDELDDGRPSFRILVPSQSSSSPMSPTGPLTRSRTTNIPTNTYARSLVYDLRNYTLGSMWGPFKADGSGEVDWEKVEAIMVVLGYNLRVFRERARFEIKGVWHTPWVGANPDSYVSPPPVTLVEELGAPGGLDYQDPYGISGMWIRVVCFLDYHDLYAFNFTGPPPPDGQPRGPIDIREAIRMIKLKLNVTKIEPPSEGDGQDFPVVTFTGLSWSMHEAWDANANSKIRGVVRQTPEGEIRWTTWSIFHGEERWRSEGIQLGGVRSARGVLGNWFDKDFDIHGPAGPTAFWKISDELDDDDKLGAHTPDFADFASEGANNSDSGEDEEEYEVGDDVVQELDHGSAAAGESD